MKKVSSFLKSLWKFTYAKDKPDLDPLPCTKEEYLKSLLQGKTKEQITYIFWRAWEAKNFQIENYWKRANYSWAFQIASFAGYFTILSSDTYSENPQILFFIVCIGFITSLAWTFINIGSKSWQRHWETHVDLLEDEVIGTFNKIVTTKKIFSVTKLNEMISGFVVIIWIILGVKYFTEHITFIPKKARKFDWQIFVSTIAALYFAFVMYFGYGRTLLRDRKVKLYKRNLQTK